jgi:hypothetical protein
MLAIRWGAGHADEQQGHKVIGEIGQRMDGIADHRQRAGGPSDQRFGQEYTHIGAAFQEQNPLYKLVPSWLL